MTDKIITNYGQERDLICTEQEREIFEDIQAMIDAAGLESELLRLVRKSDNYVSVVLESPTYGSMDVARIKYTNRAKWIWTEQTGKVKIDEPKDVTNFAEALTESFRFNAKYL